ncbi:MAG: tRNA uridine(34) 5-carboxymethylaminomethyl modification radical SAM/GNAT enzyme Elp3 [Candidatus Magasanikbacteria bacterium CG10_big_fil_rev_8_21_14_0_10_47_10]|uniref:tRNA carboxymethyluridine synthase n=1 Tax=Candidatus Magasanikbacteria bacterium CG10_big_fil_rev_8_21_14_0_10_47_10 TaxID=1974652 RepID=A0A2H0TRV6_9BACT|nr:MAG: tRNA uridine(34) 5-carboxymethylaminomethyl modification radical SAM/GNAT enzyme Elp3 [Candidatus Magasanikbacteria bacterium CG10_big_fil_rev_8_21_14_0_10_47_10]
MVTEKQLETIVLDILEKKPLTKAEFDDIRRRASSKLGINQPANRDVLRAYHDLIKKKRIAPAPEMEHLFMKAGIRSTSGIAVITSLLKPYTCPGKCIYCPTEVRMPKSYIASEPAAARSLRLNFNPYLLMQKRIEMLEKNGHPTDKIEYITKGGTWNAYPLKYQYWYILESFKACNNLSREIETPFTEEAYWNDKPLEALMDAVDAEQIYNESADHRIIGITLETRPDAISPKSIYHMRRQGCTRVELGLQAPDDAILKLVHRGHTVDEFKIAMKLLRDAGFKVDLHFMPDLPGTTPAHDVEMYKLLFEDTALRPDMVKIYPNTVIKSAELYQWFLDGRYKPYGDEALFDALLEMKKSTPRYCRISRLIRDIPATEIEAGNIVTNLREVLAHKMAKNGDTCECLRCREISRHKNLVDAEQVLFVDEYETVGGKEYFITFEDKDRTAVFGFLRLRIPTESNDALEKLMPEIKHAAFIRELHVYGQLVSIGERDARASQHKGLGKKLVAEAERIAAEQGFQRVAVISGVGVRGYYAKLGYTKEGTYMVKKN